MSMLTKSKREKTTRLNMMQKLAWLLASLTLFVQHAYALRAGEAMTSYYLQNWYSDEGLPHNTVHSITQSTDGYLWFATWNGLARFNGRNFTAFNAVTEPSFATSGVRSVVAGLNGEVWAAMTRTGLHHYKNRAWSTIALPPDALNMKLATLKFDRSGTLWIGSQGQGVLTYSPQTKQFARPKPAAEFGDTWIQNFYEDTDGSMWIAGARGLLHYQNGRLLALGSAHGLSEGASIFSVQRDSRGILWVGGETGLYRLRSSASAGAQLFEAVKIGLKTAVQTISEDKNGNVWVGTQSGGLLRLRGDGAFDRLMASRGLANNRVMALHEDREGSLWVGTNAGLTRLSDSPFFRISRRDGLNDEFIRSIFPVKDGSVWIGTSRGLGEFKDGSVRKIRNAPISNASITSVIEDKTGTLWVGTYDAGLSRRVNGQWQTMTRADSALPSNQVRALLEAADGSIWVGTAQGLLHIAGAVSSVYTTADGLPRDYTLSLMQASDSSIWVGTGSGFAVLGGENVKTYSTAKGFPADNVFHMLQDGAGVVWLATDRGLVRFREGKFDAFGRAQGLPDETLFAVSEDRKGNFWLSSNSGLMRLARREIERLGRAEITVMQVDLFGRSDGMSAAQINGASFPSTSVDDSGRLWLPTARGVTVLDPAHLIAASQKPVAIVLESIKFDQQEQSVSAQIYLPTTVRRLEFVFAGLSYLMAERMQIRYKMHGYDSDWITATPDGAAVYMRLKPGTYQLEAQAGNNQTGWSAPFKIQVKVAAKFYEYWAFWPAVVLLSGLLGVAFSRSLIAAKDRRQRALESEVALRTAELSDRNQNLAAADVEKTALLKTIQMQAEAFSRQAREDALTGLPNRRFFDLRCAEAFERVRSKGGNLVVAISDVDHFKRVNDEYSHQVGDQVLKAIADTAAKTLAPVGMVARYGGEEFAIFFHDLSLKAAASLLQQVCADVQKLRFSEQSELRVSISIGVTDCPAAESYERALMHADALLYLAKANGRNQVVSRTD